MIVIEKVMPKKEYICSFCGTGSAVRLIAYKDERREARVPMCQVCYEELTEQVTAPAPKKSTRKKKESD